MDDYCGDTDVRRCVALIAAHFQDRVGEISLAIGTTVGDNIPELRGDAAMIELLATSVQANVEMVFHALRHDIPVAKIDPPGPSLEFARRSARHVGSANALVRAFRLGQRQLTELVFAELRALDLEPAMQVAVIESITTMVFEYVERVSEQAITEYEAERDRWLENQNSIRAMQVRDVLSGETSVDAEEASAAVRYPLHWQHLALILWYVSPEVTGDELSRLHRFTRDLAAATGASTEPLFAAADRTSAWVWLPFRSAPGDIVAAIREHLRVRQDVPNIAVGAIGSGIDGFRRSHRQAQRVRAAHEPAPGRASVIAAATDSAMLTAALEATSTAEVREWVADVLGGLAADTDEDALLRQTLRVFLRPGATHEDAARELDVTFNALKKRVERAVARRGRPIDDRHDVDLALRACQWYGAAVLRPA